MKLTPAVREYLSANARKGGRSRSAAKLAAVRRTIEQVNARRAKSKQPTP